LSAFRQSEFGRAHSVIRLRHSLIAGTRDHVLDPGAGVTILEFHSDIRGWHGKEHIENSNLIFAESAFAIRDNVARFNSAFDQYAERTLSVIRQSQYWVYSEDTGMFAPSKFSAYEGMNFPLYEKAVAGKTGPAHFHGTSARERIEEILKEKFKEDDLLSEQLIEWADSLVGPGVISGVEEGKWRFLRLSTCKGPGREAGL
jgi:hypothetical protein